MIALKVSGLSQAPDHRVAAGLDLLGDGDLALAGEEFDRAHLAQVHAHGVVGAVDGFLLGRCGRPWPTIIERVDLFLGRLGLLVLLVVGRFLVLDDVDAHFGDRGHHVLDLLGRHLVLREGLVQFIVGDEAALLGAGEQFLDRRVVEVEERGVPVLLRLGLYSFVLRHICACRLVGAGQ